MCRKTRFGRARHRFRKLLNGLGLCHGRRSGDADPGLKAVDGSDPPSRHASIGIGEDGDVHPHLPLRCGVTPIQQSRAGRPRRAVTGLVPVLLGDAEQPGGSAGGQRVLRRLEAALDTLPGGIAGAGATPGGRGGWCASTPGLEPVPGPRTGGSLPPRPEPLVCHGLPSSRAARRCCTRGWPGTPVRMAGASKCALDPRVVCALQYGRKSHAAHRLACSGEALGLPRGARGESIACRLSTGRRKTLPRPPMAGGHRVNRRRAEV